MITRLLSGLVCLVAAALVVDLFFRWTEGGGEFSFAVSGLDSIPGFVTFAAGLMLFLWELLGLAGVRRTLVADSLVAFFLAGAAGIGGIANVVHLRWGETGPTDVDLAVAALLAIPLSILLLAGAAAHLSIHVLASRPPAAR